MSRTKSASQKPRARSGSISRWFRTDKGMTALLNKFVGPGRWIYDRAADRWMYPAPSYASAPGERCFVVISRDGAWHIELLAEGAIQ